MLVVQIMLRYCHVQIIFVVQIYASLLPCLDNLGSSDYAYIIMPCSDYLASSDYAYIMPCSHNWKNELLVQIILLVLD
jgi:hypothetical protein